MVGRDRTTLARAESEIGVELPARNPENNRRVGYTLEQVQAFRAHFGTLAVAGSGDGSADRRGLPELQGRGGQVDDLREPGALPGAQGLPGAGGGHRQPGDHDLDVRLRAGCRDRRGRDHPAVPVRVPEDARLRGPQVLLAEHRPDPGVPRAVRGGARDRHAPGGAAGRREAGAVLPGAQVRAADGGRQLRRDPARFAAGARHDLDQRADGGRCAAGAVGGADVRFQLDRAVLPDGAQLHRQDRRDQAVPLDLGADDAVRPALREPEAVLRGDDGRASGTRCSSGCSSIRPR